MDDTPDSGTLKVIQNDIAHLTKLVEDGFERQKADTKEIKAQVATINGRLDDVEKGQLVNVEKIKHIGNEVSALKQWKDGFLGMLLKYGTIGLGAGVGAAGTIYGIVKLVAAGGP